MTVIDQDRTSWFNQDSDDIYLSKVLRHEPVELSLDDSVRWSLVAFMWFRAALGGWIASFIALILTIVAGGGDSFGSDVFIFLFSAAVFFFIFLRSKFNQPIGEWRVLLSGRSHCVDSVYSVITGVIYRRQMPLTVRARRMINDPQTRTWASRLIITDGPYTAYVTVFPYGTSLYLGWSMWRRRSGAALAKRFFADLFGSLFGVVDLIRVMLRTDRPRAMREAVHSACREGLKVAVMQTVVPVEYGFAQGLPVVEAYVQTEMQSAPIPAALPVPPVPPVPQQAQPQAQSQTQILPQPQEQLQPNPWSQPPALSQIPAQAGPGDDELSQLGPMDASGTATS